jgi:hypothetical protein
MGLPSCFLEKKFVKHEKGDDITPFDGTSKVSVHSCMRFLYKSNTVYKYIPGQIP